MAESEVQDKVHYNKHIIVQFYPNLVVQSFVQGFSLGKSGTWSLATLGESPSAWFRYSNSPQFTNTNYWKILIYLGRSGRLVDEIRPGDDGVDRVRKGRGVMLYTC